MRDFPDNILFVIVLYRQSFEHCKSWISLKAELKEMKSIVNVLIYDNSPDPQHIPQENLCKIDYHHDATNPGVGRAYNFGGELADELGKSWMMLLDQDSELTPGALQHYGLAVEGNPDSIIFAPIVRDIKGILSPFLFRFGGGRRLQTISSRMVSLKTHRVINSGMLVSTTAFRSVGGYADTPMLDFSDIVFLSKLQLQTNHVVIVNAGVIQKFSGSESQDCQSALERYKIYSQGSRTAGSMLKSESVFWTRSFLRACQLSVRYQSLAFLMVHFQTRV